MRTVLISLCVLSLLGGACAAQRHSHGWFVTGVGHLHHVATNGKVTSVAWPGGSPEHAMMDWTNRTVLVHDFSKRAILRVDPVRLAVLGTLMTTGFNHIRNFQSATMDHNGDIYFGASMPRTGIFRIDQQTLGITLVRPSTGGSLVWPNQFSTDILSGEILVGDDSHTNTDDLFVVRRDGTKVSWLANLGGPTGFTMGCYRHINTGDIYSGDVQGGLWVIRLGHKAATLGRNLTWIGRVMAPCPDRASAKFQALVMSTAAGITANNGVWQFDLANSNATQVASIPRTLHRCVPVFGRNLQSIARSRGTWDVHVSFPGHPGKPFVVAFSASGPRVGPVLKDGRTIPLRIDAVTVASLTTGFPGLVTGNLGQKLNGSGASLVSLNLLPLGMGANGMKIWMCAAVLDPQAPLGIAVIADPKVLVIEGI